MITEQIHATLQHKLTHKILQHRTICETPWSRFTSWEWLRAPVTQSSSYVVRQLSKCSSYVEAAAQFHRTDLLRTPGSTILASLWDVTACLLPCRSCAAQQRWKCKSKVHTSNRRPQQTPFSPPKAAGGCCQPGPVPLLEDFSSQDAD